MSMATKQPETQNGPPEPPSFGPFLLAAVAFAFMASAFIYHNPFANQQFLNASASTNIKEANRAASQGDFKGEESILRSLAENGNADAQYRLGRIYEMGLIDGEPNFQEAKTWFEKASDQGVVKAKVELGHLYLDGVGVLQNFDKARNLLEEASADGNAKAQFDLARMWQNGWGGEKNAAMAYAYYEFAARQDFKPAVKARDTLLASLNPTKVSEAQSLLRKLESQQSGENGKKRSATENNQAQSGKQAEG